MAGEKHLRKPQAAIPALVHLVHLVHLVRLVRLAKDGRLPLHRLISHYPFADIEQAVRDMNAGKTIKPVLTFWQPF